MEKLTEQERQAMLALWKIKTGTARQIFEAYDEGTPVHYNTLRSTLSNLGKKGYLEIKPVGMSNEYFPIISENEYKKQNLSELVRNHFNNSFKDLVSFFSEEKDVSDSELSDIMDIIKNKRTK
jgi:predicted transcriptional regulator